MISWVVCLGMTGRKAFIICGGRTLKQSNEFASDVEKERAKLSLPVIQMAVILFTNIRRKNDKMPRQIRKRLRHDFSCLHSELASATYYFLPPLFRKLPLEFFHLRLHVVEYSCGRFDSLAE